MQISIKHRLEYLGLTALKTYANSLSETDYLTAGARFGATVRRLWSSRVAITRTNIERAFPDWIAPRVDALVDEVFANIGRTAFEVLRFDLTRDEQLSARFTSNGTEVLAQAADEGRGALLLSGHIGNWELFGAWVRSLGYPLDIVVKPMRNPLTDKLFNDLRAVHDVGIIHTQTATTGIVRSVRKKRFVAILADQYAGREGVDVEFFGRHVSTPRGPAALSLKYGCPILTGHSERQPDGTFVAHIDGPLEVEQTGDHERDVEALTQGFTSRLERYIRRQPGQWLWTHRRWGSD